MVRMPHPIYVARFSVTKDDVLARGLSVLVDCLPAVVRNGSV